MKVDFLDLKGKKKGKLDLPEIFSTPYRPDIIKRAVLAAQSARRQKYGTDKMAGKRTSAHYHGSSHLPPDQKMMHREMARLPREHGDTARFMRARLVPQTTGGRRAHPPKVEKKWIKNINKKERLLAIRSAIGGTGNSKLVELRNHSFNLELPIVVEDSIQEMDKTKDFIEFLKNIGLGEELERIRVKRSRSGKAKLRRGKFKKRIGPLLVIEKDDGILKAAKNVSGVDVVNFRNLNAEVLSPGSHGIRLTIWTKSAIEKIGELNGKENKE